MFQSSEAKLAVVALAQLQSYTDPTSVAFWIEKAIAVGVLIWVIQDMRVARSEAQKAHEKALIDRDAIHKSHQEEVKSIYESQIEVLRNLLNNTTQYQKA